MNVGSLSLQKIYNYENFNIFQNHANTANHPFGRLCFNGFVGLCNLPFWVW